MRRVVHWSSVRAEAQEEQRSGKAETGQIPEASCLAIISEKVLESDELIGGGLTMETGSDALEPRIFDSQPFPKGMSIIQIRYQDVKVHRAIANIRSSAKERLGLESYVSFINRFGCQINKLA